MSKSPSTLTPKAALSVKGELAPSVALTFAKKAQGTKFSFTITDQTLWQPSEFKGYVVSASRADGAHIWPVHAVGHRPYTVFELQRLQSIRRTDAPLMARKAARLVANEPCDVSYLC